MRPESKGVLRVKEQSQAESTVQKKVLGQERHSLLQDQRKVAVARLWEGEVQKGQGRAALRGREPGSLAHWSLLQAIFSPSLGLAYLWLPGTLGGRYYYDPLSTDEKNTTQNDSINFAHGPTASKWGI